jgi:type I restriction enzyme M protein
MQMQLSTLENWLWKAACSIRGEVDAARYKDYILPLIFYKRLDDVYADELVKLAETLSVDTASAERLAAVDRTLIRFYVPTEARWDQVRKRTKDLGERLTDTLRSIAKENPKLEGVIDRRDFNATDQGQRVLDDDVLAKLIGILSEQRLGLQDAQPDILGRAYEYLIRKFAERGSSAGEFFTPTEVGFLIARILDPQPGEIIYDPACGSGGLLIKAQLRHREKLAEALDKSPDEISPDDDPQPINLCGQELQADNVAAAKMNAFIHDMVADVRQGNTMRNPTFFDASGSLQRFDKIAANPMWNQDNVAPETYDTDKYGRFVHGIPPHSSADWGWIQHMYASLLDGGRMAVVLDTGAASRGSGNKGANKERDIRKHFVDADMVEAVILLPENLFFNTSAPGIILVMQRTSDTPRAHADEIMLINASKFRDKGRPKNYMTDEQVQHVADLLLNWQEEEHVSKVVKRAEIIRNDYNLSPSRYVTNNDVEPPLPLEEAIERLRIAEEARAEADCKLDSVMQLLGFTHWRDVKVNEE